MDLTALQKSIIKTIAWFDLFDFPLTSLELWQALDIQTSFEDVFQASQNLPTQLQTKQGFIFLTGREQIITTRLRRYNYTDRKFKRLLKLTKLFRYLPSIKLIAMVNLMGAHNLKNDSDIDVFIVTAKNQLWLTRFILASFLKIMGLRPGIVSQDKICLSFLIDETDLNLQKFTLPNQSDLYFIHWLANLTPVYDQANHYQKLISANYWLNQALPNWQIKQTHPRRTISAFNNKFLTIIFNIKAFFWENTIKKWQLKILAQPLKNLMNIDTRVIINDHVLKLHVTDRRLDYLARYEAQLAKLK